MEVSTFTTRGYQINVIFTGSHYFFHSPYAGVIAIAERKGYATDKERDTFILKAGNSHLVGGSLGGSVMFGVAERFIRRNENKYVEHTTYFEREEFKGENYRIDVTASRYGA